MGERDPGLGPAAPSPPWAQRAVLGLMLGGLLAAVMVFGRLVPAGGTWHPGAGVPAVLTQLLESILLAIWPSRAPGLLGALALILAAVLACRALERRIGPQAPLLVALLAFGSGVWALVWTDGAALVPLGLAVTAFAVAYGEPRQEPRHEPRHEPSELYRPPSSPAIAAVRWLVVGLLLAELVPSGLQLAGLLLPAAMAVPRERRAVLLPALFGGFAVGLAVELIAQGWEQLLRQLGVALWTAGLDPVQIGKNLLLLVAGRNVGLLLGFAPLLLLLAGGRGSAGRPALAAVGVSLPVLSALLLPFDYAGGWLNLSFVAVYGALWHLPSRPPRRWQWALALLLCGLATWPLWLMPREALGDGGAGLTAARPRRHLPYETTLRFLPNRGEGRLPEGGPLLRAVDGCRMAGEPGRFQMLGDGPAQIWIAAPSSLEMVALEFGAGSPSTIEVGGATAGRTVFRPDGRVGFEVLLDRPRERHRLWDDGLWDDGPRQSVHLVDLSLPARQGAQPLSFRLLAAPQP